MPLSLSKSKYCSALQCPKMLWLMQNRPEVYDNTVENQSALETGNEVGDLAMGLFGAYEEVPFGSLSDMVNRTTALINADVPVIAEATFSCNRLHCSADILKNLGAGCVEIYEVKSSTSVKECYYDDAAFQCYVLTQLGYTVRKVALVYINNQYTRFGELDIQQLFHIEDITNKVTSLLPCIAVNIDRIDTYMRQPYDPSDDIGAHCFSPYPCGYFGYCTRNLPKPNVFDVAGARLTTKLKCYEQGIISFAELNICDKLSAGQHMQVEHELFNYEPHIEVEPIRAFLGNLSYPLYFLDFESFQPAIPLYDASRPFEQIVFQYSLHYIEHEGGELKHTEYLAYPGADPRRALAEQLCQDIPMDVCTTAYNMGFEKGRIKGLAELYPDLSEHLMNIHDHIHDLMIPFQRKYYYTKAMQGSYSIKYVLPALFPDDPTLDYHNLKGVHNGSEASAAFKQMTAMSPEEVENIRTHLLAYCGLDTYAMVKVWEKLNEVAGIRQ